MHNRRNQVAAKSKPPRERLVKSASPPQFPGDVAVPPHRGASLKSVDLPILKSAVPARVAAQPLFALPEREPSERLRTPAKAKRRKASAKRRKASSKAGGKLRAANAAKPRPSPAEALAVFALPQRAEPLVIAPPAPLAKQSRALAVVRPAGLLGAIGSWLNLRAQGLWRQLGTGPGPRDRAEIHRLRAENSRLKAQLEAFAALQARAAFAPPDRVKTPVT